MEEKEVQSIRNGYLRHTKSKTIYDGLKICTISVEHLNVLLASSVIEQNDMIKATRQEVVEYDFSDETTFDLNWE